MNHHNLIDEKYAFELIATSPSLPKHKTDSSVTISDKIAEIRENKISRYEPLIKPEGGLTYTGFSDSDFARQLDILGTLQRLGIVKEEPFDYIRNCSKCDHHGMLVKVACPACSSTNTDQGKVIEHLTCGHIDVESKFQLADEAKGGGLVCPKCRKKLKAIGVDYVKPGSYCACLSCKTLSPEGRMQFVCLNCGSSLTKEEMKLEHLSAYVVDQQALERYLDKTGVQLHGAVVEALRERGINAAQAAVIAGTSQLQHTFDVVGYAGKDALAPIVAIEIESSGEPVNPESLLNFLARCIDAKVPNKVFVGVLGFTQEAKKLAEAHGIKTIESVGGKDSTEIANRIADSIPIQELVADEQLEQMIDSISESVEKEENQSEQISPEAEDLASLEVMLRTIISPKKEEQDSKQEER